MSTRRFAALALATLWLSGCSAILDPWGYRGEGAADAGPGDDGGDPPEDGGRPEDAGRDAGPDAPSTPVVAIAPATPRTLDDLVASITTESVDPLGDTVTYQWSWEVDGAASSETTETVIADATTKGETWTVFATPVTGDGRRGLPGSASVTIANTPPRIRTVGLSSYRPVSGDLVTAFVDGVTDDDPGDSPTLSYTWALDGTDTTVSGSRFSPGTPPGAGQELTVTVTADDGDDTSAAVVAGPAVFVADTTRWVQHLPNRAETMALIWDQRHGRLLVLIQASSRFSRPAQIWEYLVDRNRWVQLRLSETIPNLGFRSVVQDPDRGKIYFVGSYQSEDFEVVELDVGQRGSESLRTLTYDAGATLPTHGFVYSAIFDEGTDRIVFAHEDDATSELALWSLDATGTDAMVIRESPTVPVASVGSTWVHVPGTRRVLVFGGGDPSATTLVPNDRVHELDLDDLPSGIVELSETLPAPSAFPVAVADPERDRVIVAFGIGPDFAAVTEGWVFDTTTNRFDTAITVDVSGGPEAAFFGWADRDRETGRVVVTAGMNNGIFNPLDAELWELDLAALSVSGLHVYGVHVPGPLSGSIGGSFDGDFHFYGGETPYDEIRGEMWDVGISGGAAFTELTRVEPTADPTAGVPGPRAYVVVDQYLDELAFFGGIGDAGPADSTVWQYAGGAWTAFQTAAGETPPTARQGHIVAQPSCADDILYANGLRETGGHDPAVGSIDCPTGSTTGCTWTVRTATGTSPTTAFAASYVNGSTLYVIGGNGNFDAVDAYGSCSDAWTSVPIDGAWTGRRGASVSGSFIFGGRRGSSSASYFDDVHRIMLDSGSIRFEPVTVATDGDGIPAPREAHVAAWDTGRIFVYGGTSGTAGFLRSADFQYADLWELRFAP